MSCCGSGLGGSTPGIWRLLSRLIGGSWGANESDESTIVLSSETVIWTSSSLSGSSFLRKHLKGSQFMQQPPIAMVRLLTGYWPCRRIDEWRKSWGSDGTVYVLLDGFLFKFPGTDGLWAAGLLESEILKQKVRTLFQRWNRSRVYCPEFCKQRSFNIMSEYFVSPRTRKEWSKHVEECIPTPNEGRKYINSDI